MEKLQNENTQLKKENEHLINQNNRLERIIDQNQDYEQDH